MRFNVKDITIFLSCYIFITVFFFIQFQKYTNCQNSKEAEIKPLMPHQDAPIAEPVVPDPVEPIPDECACQSTVTGKIYDFCYKLPEDHKKIGKRFDCKWVDEWERIESGTKFIDLKTEKAPEPVFVTAFNDPFVNNGKRLIASIRKLGFRNKIILYDLGITQENLDIFKEKSCNVEIRHFNFTKYPDYMKQLKSYRWKLIFIAESLKEYGSIWIMDASITIEKKDLSHVYDLVNCHGQVDKRPPLLPNSARDLRESKEPHERGWDHTVWERNLKECRKSTYLLHGYSGHGIMSVTHPDVYTYIPTNMVELKKPKAKMYDSGFVYAVNTRQTMMEVIKWSFLCALQEDCMAPTDSSLGCSFPGDDRFKKYVGCHRYDQSIINLVLANQFWYDRRYYVSEIVDFFHIERTETIGDFEENMGCR